MVDANGKPVMGPDGKPDGDRHRADDRAGPGGLAGDHQGVRHQRRWFFNANSAHPFENPTPLIESHRDVLDLRHFGRADLYAGPHDGVQRHGWAVWAAMAFLFLAGVTTAYWAETRGNPLLAGVNHK